VVYTLVFVVGSSPPDTLRRRAGRSGSNPAEAGEAGGKAFTLSESGDDVNTDSPLRAFSRFICIVLKCDKSSDHRMASSRPPSLERIMYMVDGAGPSELTEFRQFCNEIKALLCGNSIKSP